MQTASDGPTVYVGGEYAPEAVLGGFVAIGRAVSGDEKMFVAKSVRG